MSIAVKIDLKEYILFAGNNIMALKKIYPFINPLNYSFPAEIDVSGGEVSNALVDNEGLEFIQDFLNDTGFVYDNTKAEFADSKVSQVDKRPEGATAYIPYTNNLDTAWGNGVQTGSAFGGASILNGELNLSLDDVRGVDYDAIANASSIQKGCIRIVIRPIYSEDPATSQQYPVSICKADNDTKNLITFFHDLNGQMVIGIYDKDGVAIMFVSLGTWVPSGSSIYEFELNYDITFGATRLFINGQQIGATQTQTGTRDANINLLRIGSNYAKNATSKFRVIDVLIFDSVQHTTNYTPDWTNIFETIYLGSKIECPQKSYSGPGQVQKYTNFETTVTGAPRFVRNDLYHNGAEWVTSDGSYAQASTTAEIAANIDTFPASDTLDIDVVFEDSNTLGEVGLVTDTYTGKLYSQNDPIIRFNAPVTHDGLISFLANIIARGVSDSVAFFVSKGVVSYWFNGAEWAVSDESLAQSNTYQEINNNSASFTDEKVVMYISAILHSEDGLTTAKLTQVEVEYDFAAEDMDTIDTCIVWLYEAQLHGLIPEGETIEFQQKNDAVKYKTNVLLKKIKPKEIEVNPTTGLIEIELVETENMALDAYGNEQTYRVFIGQKIFEINVPNIVDKNLIELLGI